MFSIRNLPQGIEEAVHGISFVDSPGVGKNMMPYIHLGVTLKFKCCGPLLRWELHDFRYGPYIIARNKHAAEYPPSSLYVHLPNEQNICL
jgi:hypothetical protein